jgi:hypothetical protein
MSCAKHQHIRLKFFSILWSKSIIGRVDFPAHQKNRISILEKSSPGAGMTAFKKYRSNPYRIVRDDAVPDTEALNAAQAETGAASATCCSTSNNVNRAKA